MKKYIFGTFYFFYITIISCCPFGFSPEDQRPFFEQYENKSHSLSRSKESTPHKDPKKETNIFSPQKKEKQ